MADISDDTQVNNKLALGAPAANLIITGIIVIIIAAAAFFQMTQQPWIGVRFSATEGDNGIVAAKIYPDSPADAALREGMRFLTISDGHNIAKLDSILLEEPNNLPTYKSLNHSLHLQDDIWRILTKETIQLQTDDGNWVTVKPKKSRPLFAIPKVFWLYPPLGSIGVFISVFVWVRQPKTFLSVFISLFGWSYYIGMCEMMLIDRELALPHDHMKSLLSGENFATNLFVASLLSIFFTFPSRIFPPKYCSLFFAAAIIIPLNSTYQWIELPVHAFLIHFLFWNSAVPLAAWMQWKRARNQPLNKAVLLWLILWMCIPTLIAIIIFVVPMTLGHKSIIPIEQARLVISFFSIGLAFGIFHFQLFDIERCWFLTLNWIIGSVLVLALDALLLYFIHLQPTNAAALSLIIAGLIYFPFRQWLLTILLPTRKNSSEESIVSALSDLSSQHYSSNNMMGWTELIKAYFNPLRISPHQGSGVRASVTDNGLSLIIPGDEINDGFLITGKNYGKDLFNKEDTSNVEALHGLTRMISDARDAAQKAAESERQRIMQDLHDTMGAQLLTLIHRSDQPEYTQEAREVLQNLRESVRILATLDSPRVSDLLADWRVELREKAELNRFELNWPFNVSLNKDVKIDPYNALSFSYLARELLVNIPVKATPRAVDINVRLNKYLIYIIVSICGGKATDIQGLFAMSSLQRIEHYARLLDHKATVEFSGRPETELVIKLKLTLSGRQ